MTHKPSIAVLFNHPAVPDLAKIRAGELPSERLYGVVELLDKGWAVKLCDDRFSALGAGLAQRMRPYGFHIIPPAALRRVVKHDLILVKDDFSLPLTLLARLRRKRIIYLDSLFAIPRNRLRRLLLTVNARLAPLIMCYSDVQARLWSRTFGVPPARFRVVRYGIDCEFYRNGIRRAAAPADQEAPYVLSVGRDMGRDFDTLVRAVEGTGLRVKLVTLPYLVSDAVRRSPHVDVLQRVSYPELFRLYAGAEMAVVPLRRGITYPSGIRAVMEALAVGMPTISTRTPVLEEYFPPNERTVHYVDGEDPESLRRAIIRLRDDEDLKRELAENGRAWVTERYHIRAFVQELESTLAEYLGVERPDAVTAATGPATSG